MTHPTKDQVDVREFTCAWTHKPPPVEPPGASGRVRVLAKDTMGAVARAKDAVAENLGIPAAQIEITEIAEDFL